MSLALLYLLILPIQIPAYVCAAPVRELHTPEAWSAADQSALATALVRCKQLYPTSPCLTRFIRVEPRRYRVMCGAAR